MGLDMYLKVKIWTSKYTLPELNKKLLEATQIKSCGNIDSIEVIQQIGYWRKANQIHKWFVDVVQNGKDECDEHTVTREELRELKTLCLRVLDDHSLAVELLPTASGFFFGPTEYDEYYFDELEETCKIIEYALSLDEDYELVYCSSW